MRACSFGGIASQGNYRREIYPINALFVTNPTFTAPREKSAVCVEVPVSVRLILGVVSEAQRFSSSAECG